MNLCIDGVLSVWGSGPFCFGEDVRARSGTGLACLALLRTGEGRGRRRAQTVLFCSFPHDLRVGAGRLSGVFCTYAADVMSYSALLLPANYFKSTLSFLEGSLT